MFLREWFFDLEKQIRDAGLDSDSESFDVIKSRLQNKEHLSADEFARQAIYVVLAGGFSQKTAKTIHKKICDFLSVSESASTDDLIKLFNNKNKINAVVKIWENRDQFRNNYYEIDNEQLTINSEQLLQKKLDYLSKLPHIGKITANHLARNLGEDIVKYDIWIQRLGVEFVGARPDCDVCEIGALGAPLQLKISNQKLNSEIKTACDEMFAHLVRETGLPRGYIDVVLWKACQQKMIEFKE